MEDRMTRHELTELLATCRQLHKDGTIESDVFHQLVFKIASEYLNIGETDTGLDLLRGLPREYYDQTVLDQMEETVEFCDLAYDVAKYLVDNKHVTITDSEESADPDQQINMKPGLA